MRPRLLDLFCGAGGAAMGYHRAGFDVVGVDIKPQPNYPFEFHQADATVFRQDFLLGCWHEGIGGALPGRLAACLGHFDAVHASPPCHDKSALRHVSGDDGTGWMLRHTLDMLRATSLPYVVENVEGAGPDMGGNWAVFCGSSFGLCTDSAERGEVWLRRHRLFTSNVALLTPSCSCRGKRIIGVYGNGDGGGRGWKGSMRDRRSVMGIDWMTRTELSQAIPPAYTEHIGRQLLASLGGAA